MLDLGVFFGIVGCLPLLVLVVLLLRLAASDDDIADARLEKNFGCYSVESGFPLIVFLLI